MISYTVASVAVLSGLVLLLFFRFGYFFSKPRVFWSSLVFILVAQLVFDNAAVWRGFWWFKDSSILGVRVPFMPLENVFFGVSLFLFTIFCWESFSDAKKSEK